MNKIIQHIPNYCDGFEPLSVEFNTLNELLSIDFVQRYKNLKNFYQFSISGNHLMAEYDNGYEWFVVGYLNFNVSELPKWVAKKQKEDEENKKYLEALEKENLEKDKNRVKTYLERAEESVFSELIRISNQEHKTFNLEDRDTQGKNLRRVKSEIAHIQKPYSLDEIIHEYCAGCYNAELLLKHCLSILVNDNLKIECIK